MSEFEIAIALFDFIKTLTLSEEQQIYFDALKKAWNDLQDGGSEEMSECAISNCGYYWQSENEDFPCCHYNGSWPAPCEYEEEECNED